MKHIQILKVSTVVIILAMICSSCEESIWGRDPGPTSQIGNKVYGGEHETPGQYKDAESGGGGSTNPAYPQIIKRTYIPTHEPWAGTRCLAWRITWPEYSGSVDADKIASVFSTPSGALNSFDYLNSVDPQNTYNTRFSLYHGNKVECTFGMWDELPYALNGGMETVYFAKTDQPLSIVQHWVEDRPSQFEAYWPGGSDMEFDYVQGDIILFKQVDANRYGGIRIVSVTPRIIEVYFAEPND
ncbi:MAG TPA: hypothetical protein VKZ75_09020 [Cyclobacteriaceae bacterium]|nr:hypothetical protein [Cyclobacteriaceae bacterium]